MTIGVRVEGARELRRTMRQAGEDVKQLSAVHRRISAIAAERAKELAPVQSGKLAAGIKPRGSAGKATLRIERRSVPYGGVLEYGWGRKGRPARRFTRSGVKETKEKWLDEYQRGITAIVERIKGTTPTGEE